MPKPLAVDQELKRLEEQKLDGNRVDRSAYEIARASLVLAAQVERVATLLERSTDGAGRLLIHNINR